MLYLSLQNRLKEQHLAIEEVIRNTEASRLSLVPSPGKWSAKDNIVHLAKYQPVFIERINTILKTDLPSFERYLAENDPEFERWRVMDIKDLLERMKADRQLLFNLIISLSDKDLQRVGKHPKFGMLTITQWTEFFVLHEAHHIFTIFQLTNDIQLK
ncbi:MAG: DinB family protein [Bacteroidetes bacterium]|nr:DinB family protein [Bacteroidota bacterium]